MFAGIALAAPPKRFVAPDLTALAGQARGVFAVFRLVDARRHKKDFTTYQWLAEVTRGANRAVRTPSQVDFLADAAAGHALAASLDWDLFLQARALRASLDTLNAAMVGPDSLASAILRWWVARTGIANAAGDWSTFLPGGAGEVDVNPTPSDPFRDGATRSPVAGYDEFVYLLAALRARSVVRDPKELAAELAAAQRKLGQSMDAGSAQLTADQIEALQRELGQAA